MLKEYLKKSYIPLSLALVSAIVLLIFQDVVITVLMLISFMVNVSISFKIYSLLKRNRLSQAYFAYHLNTLNVPLDKTIERKS